MSVYFKPFVQVTEKIMYKIVRQWIFLYEVQSVTLISSLNMVASAVALLHTHPVSTGSLKSVFTLLLSYLIA
jgi:HJR/Mrr/RecB family endonuclease